MFEQIVNLAALAINLHQAGFNMIRPMAWQQVIEAWLYSHEPPRGH